MSEWERTSEQVGRASEPVGRACERVVGARVSEWEACVSKGGTYE